MATKRKMVAEVREKRARARRDKKLEQRGIVTGFALATADRLRGLSVSGSCKAAGVDMDVLTSAGVEGVRPQADPGCLGGPGCERAKEGLMNWLDRGDLSDALDLSPRNKPVLELPGLNPKQSSYDIVIVDVYGTRFVTAERLSEKNALAHIVRILTEPDPDSVERMARKIVLVGNVKPPVPVRGRK